MKSGVRKSGCPIPRLMMSRPCAASALARASTAKAFSSPICSKAAMVRSMNVLVVRVLKISGSIGRLLAATELHLGHAHHLEDDGHRPANQQEPVERRDRTD